MTTTPIVLQPRWRDIADDPPKDGRWVWGEWPLVKNAGGFVISPRMIYPMRWRKTYAYKEQWLRDGVYKPGDEPVRWCEMIYPVGDEPEPLRQDNAMVREGVRHALMHLDLPLVEDNGIVDYD